MSSLTIRRILVWAISAVLGIALSIFVLMIFLPAVSPNPNEEAKSIAAYGYQYFFWTAFPFAMIFVVLFDHFAETRILPD